MYHKDLQGISLKFGLVDCSETEGEITFNLTIDGVIHQFSYGAANQLHDALCMMLQTADIMYETGALHEEKGTKQTQKRSAKRNSQQLN